VSMSQFLELTWCWIQNYKNAVFVGCDRGCGFFWKLCSLVRFCTEYYTC